MNKTLTLCQQTLPASLGNLGSYIHSIHKIPVLTTEQEKALAVRLQSDHDLGAARSLVVHNLRFVVQIARGYTGYGLPLGDLIQEGNVGLMKAVKRFDPERKVRLVSFAVHWIRAEIHEFILRNWKIVKVATTKAQRKLFFNLRSRKKRLGWLNAKEVNAVAKDLGVSSKDVLEMEKRLNGQDIAFDLPSDKDSDKSWSPHLYLVNENMDPAKKLERQDWKQYSQTRFYDALQQLDERSQDILKSRWLSEKKTTLQTLAKKYSISAERIRQIESNAIKKLKKSIAS